MKTLLLLGMLAILSGCSVAPEKPQHLNKGDFSYLNAYVDWALAEKRRQHDIAAVSVVVLDSNKIIASHHSGMANREEDTPASDNTLYRIGSVTKLFTAVSILQLVDSGKIALDAPLQQYLPQLNLQSDFDADSVTVRQVLSHHSGLPSDIWNGFADSEALDQLIPLLNEQYLSYAPGEVFSYSNVGYALLGLVIEEVSGKTYPDYLKENIFTPLGLKHAIVGVDDKNLAQAYRKLDAHSYPQIRDTAAGDIAMSARDLATFAQVMLRDGEYQDQKGQVQRLVSPGAFNQMVTPQNSQSHLYKDMPMGLAWFLFYPRPALSGKTVRWHGGATHYFHSSLITLPSEDLAVVVLANSAEAYESVTEIAEQTTRLAYEAKTGQRWPTPSQPEAERMTLSPQKQQYLSGRYISPALGEIQVTVQNGQLIASNKEGEVALIPYADGTLGVEYKALGIFSFDNSFFAQFRLIPMEYQGQIVIKEQNGGVVAQKYSLSTLPEQWKRKLGSYTHNNPDKLYKFSEIKLEESHGILQLTLFNEINGYQQILYFNPTSKDRAVNIGLTRSSGDSLQVIQDNTASINNKSASLRYLGMQFQQHLE